MNERLLQYIWQFQYFNKHQLQTTDQEPLTILFPGQLNTHQGPDFSQAKIQIGNTTWIGSVEVHIRTSDWLRHGHDKDMHYDQVILHVVWQDDRAGNKPGNHPVLELCNLVPKVLLTRYEQLLQQKGFIPCENSITNVKDIVWQGWKERLLVERLSRKAARVLELFDNNRHSWEDVFWWQLAANFGLKVNKDAFEAIARSLPVKLLARHRNQVQQLEALLLGQAGLLAEASEDQYVVLLQKEYRFLQKKYQLPEVQLPVYFLRMRPANFPTIRLAQLAMLVHQSVHLFSVIIETKELAVIASLFAIQPNDYWLYHYRLNQPTPYREKQLGATMFDSIVINTICPVLFAYGLYHQQETIKHKAINWLLATKAEQNSIIDDFKQIGIRCKHAGDSQALLELKTQYCQEKRCLECAVGNSILKTTVSSK